MGRFAEVCIEAGADAHAIDLSSAVEAASRNLRHHPNASFYQADIFNLPFADGTFDVIYSIGVLHHTPDTRRAFLSLTKLLKPGGVIAIWVYSTELRKMFGGEMLRLFTPQAAEEIPAQGVEGGNPALSRAPDPAPRPGNRGLLPTSINPDPEWRWLDTFDWYSPTYQWKHTNEEVEGWFREAGLVDIVRGPVPVSVRGHVQRRPAS